MSQLLGVRNIVRSASGIKTGEKVLILGNESTRSIVELFVVGIKRITENVESVFLSETGGHGIEPDNDVADKMLYSDVVFCLTKQSLAHTKARINANEKGTRFLSLPDYTKALLGDESLQVDFRYYLPQVQKMADILTRGNTARVLSKNGTDIVLDIANRKGNCCPGFVDETFKLASPPDIEANIAPIETHSNGIIVVDGSVPCDEIGLLSDPIELIIKNGFLVEINSKQHKTILEKIMDNDKKRVLAELGIGFNDKAKICGNMLVDEGAKGCIHFGFGSNATIGGQNSVGFHMDFVLKKPSLVVDDTTILQEGVFYE